MPAAAQPMPAPWDGSNPFNCVSQDVGTGVDFPDPDADPFCVEFDKTQQNITDLGIVDFLLNEPARTAAAVNKCFYFQSDHWTGSIVQGEQPEIWHWDGTYFFNKATGEGGVSLHNLRIGGQAMDASAYVPDAFKPYVYPGGGGGGRVVDDIPADPRCAAMVDTAAERNQVYYHELPGGPIKSSRVGPAKLGRSRSAVHSSFGPPHEQAAGGDRYNVTGGGQLRLGYRDGKAAAILTTAGGNSYRGISPGDPGRHAVNALDAAVAFKVNGVKVYEVPGAANRLFFAVRNGKVAWFALADPGKLGSDRAIARALGRLT
jgi:hypothetical protein